MTRVDERHSYPGLVKLTDDELDAKVRERLNMMLDAEDKLDSISRAYKRAVDEQRHRLDKANRD